MPYDSWNICVCPISGGSLCVQTSMLIDMYSSGMNHDIYMGTSGGCVSLFTLIAGMKHATGIRRIIDCIDLKYLLRNWSYIPIVPSWVSAFSRGTFFDLSPHCYDNLASLVTPGLLMDSEFWIGCCNLSEGGTSTLFCTTSKDRCLINPRSHDYDVKYLEGDVDRVVRAVVSSAAIPIFMPPSEIDGSLFIDGGIRATSPLTYLASSIPDLQSCHLDYVACSNIDIPNYGMPQMSNSNLIQRTKLMAQETTRSSGIVDHEAAISLISSNKNCPPHRQGRVDSHTLRYIDSARRSYHRTVLELYPDTSCEINLLHLSSHKVHCAVDNCHFNYCYRMWYC